MPKIIEGVKLFGVEYDFVINECIPRWIDLANTISNSMIGEIPRFRITPQNTCIKADNFIVIESTRAEGLNYIASETNLNCIRDNAYNSARGNKYEKHQKLYLKRSDSAKWRRLINSKEVRSYFEANGFKVIEMGIESQRKQIALLGSCNQIIVE